MPVITVSQVNRYISSKLTSDRLLQGIMVKGEISDFSPNYRSGHWYFTLKDSTGKLSAVMFKSMTERLRFMPEEGMSVIASGSITVYEPNGAYQLRVTDLIPDGAGKQSVALEQLKRKLEKEGIFAAEHKRPLPTMPRKIGVVTSLSGAAVRDVINVLSRRYPLCEVYAAGAAVQGDQAPDSICAGIARAENAGCDVLIVGRGGGSAEDLAAFNDEKVVRAVYNCRVPVISAVGHEVDFSLADLAADMRAPTPSAAAELAAPDIRDLFDRVDALEARLNGAVSGRFERLATELNRLTARLTAQSPENRLRLMEEKLNSLDRRILSAAERYIDRCDSRLRETIGRLESLSPLKVMARGYSLAYKGDSLIRTSVDISEGDSITLRFDTGGAEANIVKKW